MDKKTAMTVNNSKMPKEIKDLQKVHQDNVLRLQKAIDQRNKWQAEARAARIAHSESNNKFEAAFIKWDKKENKPKLIELVEVDSKVEVIK